MTQACFKMLAIRAVFFFVSMFVFVFAIATSAATQKRLCSLHSITLRGTFLTE
jgi:hypothetical protein